MIKPPNIIVIKSKTSELKKVEVFLDETFKYYELSKEGFSKVLLCVSEAVVNSIEHGNKFDESKNVSIEAICSDEDLSVIVKDEGEGYDISKIDNPILKQNLKKESGRGIHIIKSYCDNMKVSKNEILIHFKKVICE